MLLNELISSKIQKYGHAQYRGIVRGSMQRSNACSAKILFMIELRSSRSSAMGSQRVRIQISKGYRADTMLETSNVLQREPQRADLNMRRELISHLPHPVFIFHVGTCGFISRQSALIAWHNAFNTTGLLKQEQVHTRPLECVIDNNVPSMQARIPIIDHLDQTKKRI